MMWHNYTVSLWHSHTLKNRSSPNRHHDSCDVRAVGLVTVFGFGGDEHTALFLWFGLNTCIFPDISWNWFGKSYDILNLKTFLPSLMGTYVIQTMFRQCILFGKLRDLLRLTAGTVCLLYWLFSISVSQDIL